MDSYIFTFSNGAIGYYEDKLMHREDGPAFIGPTKKSWYIHNRRHREDGPAIEYTDGTVEWWLNGKHMKFDEWFRKTKCSTEEFIMLKLTHTAAKNNG